jgi:hypothetical protein
MVSEMAMTRPPESSASVPSARRSAAQPARSERLRNVRIGLDADTASPATTEIRIEHFYPQSFSFIEQHGPVAIAIVHDLINHAEARGDQLVVQASVRQIAGRLPFISKDTVHRRLRGLHRAGVIRTATTRTAGQFERPTYILDLTGTGISVTQSGHAPT